jgi:peptidoglycan/LPS O-acetylase OafA/YrhL
MPVSSFVPAAAGDAVKYDHSGTRVAPALRRNQSRASSDAPIVSSVKSTRRIPAFDFTKGALILIMVLYHWMNYFLGPAGTMYKYLRFLTPSFIFLTGFTISHLYLAKYDLGDTKLRKRLLQRGLRLFATLVILNLAVGFLSPGSLHTLGRELSLESLLSAYVLGNAAGGKVIVFSVLAPISYLLLLSAGLIALARYFRPSFHVMSAMMVICVLILGMEGVRIANLELLAIGLIGISVGHVSVAAVQGIVKRPYLLILANLGYTVAITVWNELYILQIVGVCLSVAILFWLGARGSEPGHIRRAIMLLGKYSLYGYIAQIAILQVLRRGMRPAGMGLTALGISLCGAVALTYLSILAADWARRKSRVIDQLYVAVFA